MHRLLLSRCGQGTQRFALGGVSAGAGKQIWKEDCRHRKQNRISGGSAKMIGETKHGSTTRPISAPQCIARIDLADKLGQRRSMRFGSTGRSGSTQRCKILVLLTSLLVLSHSVYGMVFTPSSCVACDSTFTTSFTADIVPVRQGRGTSIIERLYIANQSDSGISLAS